MTYEFFFENNKKVRLKGYEPTITIDKVYYSQDLVMDTCGSKFSLKELIKMVGNGKIAITNPSKLKNWSGFEDERFFVKPNSKGGQNLDIVPFKLAKVTKNQAVIKINITDNFTLAQYPYLSGTMDYITVAYVDDCHKGRKQYMLSILHKDGTSTKIVWGGTSTSIVSEPLRLLRSAVMNFLKQNSVYLEND